MDTHTAPLLGVLVSGQGTTLQALLNASAAGALAMRVGHVICSDPDAPALGRAEAAGVSTTVIQPGDYADRADFDRAVAQALDASGVAWALAAGWRWLLGPAVVEPWRGRLLNVHPSLLPAFPGMHAVRDALNAGVRVTGCTVHFIDRHTDTGPIVAQAPVEVRPGDTAERLHGRIQLHERRLLIDALNACARGNLALDDDDRVVHPAGPSPTIEHTLDVELWQIDRHLRASPYTLAKYMEQVRNVASTHDDSVIARAFADGYRMLVRAQHLTFYDSAHVGDAVHLKLSLVRVGRTSLHLGHTVTRVSDGGLIAHNRLVGVYLDTHNTPTPVPDLMRSLQTPDRLPPALDLPSDTPPDAARLTLDIRNSDIDFFQHVNHAHTLRLFDDARLLAAQRGLLSADNASAPDFGAPLRAISVAYDAEIHAGDRVTVALWPAPDQPDALWLTAHRGAQTVARACCRVAAQRR